MNLIMFHRRRAERFARLLEEAGGGRRHHVRSRLDSDLAELVAIGHQASTLRPTVEVDPEFRAGLRAMLVATAEREGIGRTARQVDTPPVPRQRAAAPSRVRARGAIIVGVAVGAIAVSGMSAASEDAVPGDALYRVKRSTERAQLALASSEVTRGQLYLNFARTRVAEAGAVRGDTAGFAAVLNDMDADTRQGVKLLTTSAVTRHEPAALDAITSFVTVQRLELASLLDQVSGANRDRALDSLTLLDRVTKRAEGLRLSLSCGASASAGADGLGPKPRQCAAAAPDVGDEQRPRAVQNQPPATAKAEEPGDRREKQQTTDSATSAGPANGESIGGQPALPEQPTHPANPANQPAQGVEPATPMVDQQEPAKDGTPLLDEVGKMLGDLLR